MLQGFTGDTPILVKVTWAEGEVPLLNAEPYNYGLLAQTQLSGSGITRWFVPWAAIQYIKQDIPSGPPGTPPDEKTNEEPPASG